jgi:transposase
LAKASRKKQMVLAVEVNANPALTPIADKQSVRHLAQSFGVHPSTVYRYKNIYNHHGREERYLVEKVRGGKDPNASHPKQKKPSSKRLTKSTLRSNAILKRLLTRK